MTPSKLKLVFELGNNLLCTVESGQCIKSSINECEDKLICLNCLADSFQIYNNGRLICPVCGRQINSANGKDNQTGFNRFSVEGAREHRAHIIDNVIEGVLVNDEITKRLKNYWKRNLLPEEDYQVDTNLSEVIDSVQWSSEAAQALKAKISAVLAETIKKAINKKAI